MGNTFHVPDWLIRESEALLRREVAKAEKMERVVFGRQLTDDERAFYAKYYGGAVADDLNDDE